MNTGTVKAAALALAVAGGLAAFASGELVLEGGKTEIVVGKKAPATVKFAAKEAKYFLDRIFSRDVPVVEKANPENFQIYLGDCEASRAAGLETETLARDAFRIVAAGRAVFVAGRDDAKASPERAMKLNVWSQHYERATLFGVYELLTRFAGVRMYFPGELGEIVPKADSIRIPLGEMTIAPDTPHRYYSYFGEGVWYEGEKRDVKSTGELRWLHSYRLRMQTEYVPFCHGLAHRGYMARFHKTHPEYFCLKADGTRDINVGTRSSGKLCYTSGIWDEIYADVKSYLSGEPATARGVVAPNGGCSWWYTCQAGKYVDIMPDDGMLKCCCEKCVAAYDTDDPGNYLDTLIWSNTAKVAERLIREGVPGMVTQMAYQPYRRVPDIPLPTNILVMVAERGPWSIPYPSHVKREYDEIKAWAKKLGHRVAIWTYPCKYGQRNVPNIPSGSPWMWAEYYKGILPWVDDVYAESETDRFVYHHIDYYVLSRLAWDNSVDTDAVIDEYFRLMYGEAAAGDMKKFFMSLESKWAREFLGSPVETVWGPSCRPVSTEECWEKVYSKDVIDGLAAMLDSAESKTVEGSIERRRVRLMRREILDPLAGELADYNSRAEKLDKLKWRISGSDPLVLSKIVGKRDRGDAGDTKTEITAEVAKDGSLVIHMVCHEPEMDKIVNVERRFDDADVYLDNEIEVFIDPTGSRRQMQQYMVSSLGVMADLLCTREPSGHWKRNIKWNSGAKAEVRRLADRWTCDLTIPPSAFGGELAERFPADVFRCRRIAGRHADDWQMWSPYASGPSDFINFGTWLIK